MLEGRVWVCMDCNSVVRRGGVDGIIYVVYLDFFLGYQ